MPISVGNQCAADPCNSLDIQSVSRTLTHLWPVLGNLLCEIKSGFDSSSRQIVIICGIVVHSLDYISNHELLDSQLFLVKVTFKLYVHYRGKMMSSS